MRHIVKGIKNEKLYELQKGNFECGGTDIKVMVLSLCKNRRPLFLR